MLEIVAAASCVLDGGSLITSTNYKRFRLKAGDGLEAQNHAAAIKIRCERRIGELLMEMPKDKGGRPKNHSHDVSGLSLADIGITHMQSSRWQAMAAVAESDFSAWRLAAPLNHAMFIVDANIRLYDYS